MVALLLLAFLQGLSSDIPMQTIDAGEGSQIDQPRLLAARSPEEWASLWREHAGTRDRPFVDFGRDMVVGVFLGSRPTAGFGVHIAGAREDRGTLVVRYRETRPPGGSVAAQILTAPYQLVTLPKRSGDIRFEKIE